MIRIAHGIFLACLLIPGLPAQRLSVGVVAGGYTNRDFYSHYARVPGFPPNSVRTGSGGLILGPAIDLRLIHNLSVEAEALYKPLRYHAAAAFRDGEIVGYAPATVVTWQFPVLAKYRLPLGRVEPFVEAGPSFRAAGNLNSAAPSRIGVSGGAGVEMRLGQFSFSPRVRYTRWAGDPIGVVRTRPDQVEFLAGVRYHPDSDLFPLGPRVSLGVVAASIVTDDFPTTTSTSTNLSTGETATSRTSPRPGAIVFGPLIEIGLSQRFALEGNAIPRSTRGEITFLNGGGVAQRFSSGGFWEFPALLKYRLSNRNWRPFLALGPSFRTPKEMGGFWLSNYGVTAGAGIEVQVTRVRVAPAVRFTHWGPDRPRVAGAAGNSGIHRNQVRVVVGASF